MQYKVLIKLIVPEIEKNYEIYIPVNKTVGEVSILLNKMINEDTKGLYPLKERINLYNRYTSNLYQVNMYIRDTDIRNGTQLVFY